MFAIKEGHSMSRGKKGLAEQVVPKPRETEVEFARGKTVAEFLEQRYR